jgi:zinc protease
VPEVERYTLDDIPLFYLPAAGSTTLCLSFGVGMADEPVPRRGITHLAEHLVLAAVNRKFDHSNGSTEAFRVTFITRGKPTDASKFLTDVCRSIRTPSLARLHQEVDVLRTEAVDRGSLSGLVELWWLRTGYQGIGNVSLPEFFLRGASEDVLRSWIARHLVAGNAAIWIAGELPADLYVDLPAGPPRTPPSLQSIPRLETPTIVVREAGGVGATFEIERSAAMVTAFRVLSERLRDAIRIRRGLGYVVGTDYRPVGPTRGIGTIWASCLPAKALEVEREVLAAIDDMANRGPSEEELAAAYEERVQGFLEPSLAPARLDAIVQDVLIGVEEKPARKQLREQWSLRPDDVAAAFRIAKESMVLQVSPAGERPPRPLKPYPGPVAGPLGVGRTFDGVRENRKGAKPWQKGKSAQLTIGNDAVHVEYDGRRITAVRWADCVGVIRDKGGRILVGSDGYRVTVRIADWQSGDAAVRLIDQLAPGGLLIG